MERDTWAEVTFGEWLKRRRTALGLTQQQLALQISCSTSALRKFEAEERRPSAQIVEQLAGVFGISPNERTSFLRFARGDWQSTPTVPIEDTLWRVPRTNLPITSTSFIGREKEVEKIIQLVNKNRLVTLTGAGGVGKTRLAIQSSNKMQSIFKDGVGWVELAPLTKETLLPQAVAKGLDLREVPKQSLEETLTKFLYSKQLLLVLDNCEHLIAGCAQLVDRLLSTCPNLKILATSREALGLIREEAWPVPILSLPDAQRMSLIDLLMQYEGIHLFVERASAAKSDFTLTKQNALSVAQVCQRLDGVPLAIELAAARVKMMTVGEIAKHLDDRFDLLTAGSRTALPRHQTLRGAIDWSYDLLSQPERMFFSRISVFAGGFTLNAAKEIATGDGVSKTQVIHLLGQLINKSLVNVRARSEEPKSETRYEMLETIREYAREKLDEFGETEQVRQRHRDFFIGFAEQAEPKLKGAQQFEWLNRLEDEHDNLRAVLQWTQELGGMVTALRLAGLLFWFWNQRGYLSEGRAWLERALAAEPALAKSVRARSLYEVAYLARAQGDFAGPRELVEQSIVLWRTSNSEEKQGLPLALALLSNLVRDGGDPGTARALAEESVKLSREQANAWNLALSLLSVGMALRDQEDYNLAQSTIEESISICQELGDLLGLAGGLNSLAHVAYRRGDYEVAYSLEEEVLSIRRQLGNKQQIAYCMHCLGIFTLAQGNIERARSFFDQALVLFHEVGDKSGIVLSLQHQGRFAHLQGDDVQAQSFLEEGLTLARETGPKWISSNYLLWLADLAAERGQFERAVRLCSAAKTHLHTISYFWDAFESAYYERIINLARVSLGENAFAIAQAEGRAMTIEQAVAYALEE